MQLKEIDDTDKLKYNDLAMEYGTVFNTIEWLRLFGDKVQIYGIYDKGDNLIGGFHLYRETRFGFTIFRNPPYTPHIGPFLEIKAKNPVAIMNTWKEALFSMADFIEGIIRQHLF